jgi:hypothetical protein
MASIQTLVNLIPDANDGNIISSDYHNTIKAALLAIAGQLGGSVSETGSITVQPAFLTVGGGTAWSVSLGLATSAAGSNGFVPVSLPDGAILQQMTVMGAQTSPASKGFASLLALPIAGTTSTTLIQVDLTPGGNPFTLTGTPSPTISGLSASALQSMLTVQNSQFKYAIQAEVLGASVIINALQVTYATGGS